MKRGSRLLWMEFKQAGKEYCILKKITGHRSWRCSFLMVSLFYESKLQCHLLQVRGCWESRTHKDLLHSAENLSEAGNMHSIQIQDFLSSLVWKSLEGFQTDKILRVLPGKCDRKIKWLDKKKNQTKNQIGKKRKFCFGWKGTGRQVTKL